MSQNTMSASTIVNLIKANDSNETETQEELSVQDLLMLIGPDTDMEILLQGLREVDDEGDSYYSDINRYAQVVKYAMFHYPEIAKTHMIKNMDFRLLEYFMSALGVQSAKSKKLVHGEVKNIIDRMNESLVRDLMAAALAGLRAMFAKHPGLCIVNKYESFLPEKINDYVKLECKKEVIPATQRLAISAKAVPAAIQATYQGIVDSLKILVTNLSEYNAPAGETGEFCINTSMDVDRLDYKNLASFTSLPPKLQKAMESVTSISTQVQVTFTGNGNLKKVEYTRAEIHYTPKMPKMLENVPDMTQPPADRRYYYIDKNLWRSFMGQVDLDDNKIKPFADKLGTFKKDLMSLYKNALVKTVDLEAPWTNKKVQIYVVQSRRNNGKTWAATDAKELLKEVGAIMAETLTPEVKA